MFQVSQKRSLIAQNTFYAITAYCTYLLSKKNMQFFLGGQNLFHVIYNQNPRSNGPLKKITFS